MLNRGQTRTPYFRLSIAQYQHGQTATSSASPQLPPSQASLGTSPTALWGRQGTLPHVEGAWHVGQSITSHM